MPNIQLLENQTEQLLIIYEQKMQFPMMRENAELLDNSPWLYSFTVDMRKKYNLIQTGTTSFRCIKKERSVLRESFKHLKLFTTTALRLSEGKENIEFPEWLKNSKRDLRLVFLQNFLQGVRSIRLEAKEYLLQWMEKGLDAYDKDVERLCYLESQTTSKQDYEMLLTLKNCLLGNVRCLGLKKSVVVREMK